MKTQNCIFINGNIFFFANKFYDFSIIDNFLNVPVPSNNALSIKNFLDLNERQFIAFNMRSVMSGTKYRIVLKLFFPIGQEGGMLDDFFGSLNFSDIL